MTIAAVLNLIIIFSIAYAVWIRQGRDHTVVFWCGLAARLSAGLALGLIYQFYYPHGDTFTLFDQASALAAEFYRSPTIYFEAFWRSSGEAYTGALRAAFFVKIVSVFNILTLNSYWITSLWLSLIAFLASWKLVVTVERFFEQSFPAAALGFLFLPSAIFWSSGIIKESIALACLLSIAVVWLNLMYSQKLRVVQLLLNVVTLWILWNLKYYWAAVLIPVALASLIARYLIIGKKTLSIRAVMWWGLALIVCCFGIQFIHPNFYPGYFLTVLVDNHDAFVKISDSDNLIHYYNLQPSWGSILLNAPWALFSGMFRPFPGESSNVLSCLAGIENILLLMLVMTSLARFKVAGPVDRITVVSILFYSAILCVFLALSTPNFGSLARYKSGFTPFLVCLVAYRNPAYEFLLKRIKLKRS